LHIFGALRLLCAAGRRFLIGPTKGVQAAMLRIISPSILKSIVLAVCVLGTPPLLTPSFAQATDQTSDQDLELRIEQLETRLRQLTGQNEELQYRNRQLEEQLRQVQGGQGGPMSRSGVAAAPLAQPAPSYPQANALPPVARPPDAQPAPAYPQAQPQPVEQARIQPAPAVPGR